MPGGSLLDISQLETKIKKSFDMSKRAITQLAEADESRCSPWPTSATFIVDFLDDKLRRLDGFAGHAGPRRPSLPKSTECRLVRSFLLSEFDILGPKWVGISKNLALGDAHYGSPQSRFLDLLFIFPVSRIRSTIQAYIRELSRCCRLIEARPR